MWKNEELGPKLVLLESYSIHQLTLDLYYRQLAVDF
jgi:hypothetical protein